MDKYSAAPWVCQKGEGDEWWFGGRDGAQIVIRSGDQAVAVIGARLLSEGVPDANARLIAAAPVMLECLQRLVVYDRDSDSGVAAWTEAHRLIAEIVGG
jgi:hypothetical protein